MEGNNASFKVAKPKDGEPWDTIIIGSGPSSFTAAVYTTRGALSTLILGGETWGGQLMLTTEVENFPSYRSIMGPALMQKMKDHATSFGAEFLAKNVSAVDFSSKLFQVTADGVGYAAKSVIIATGSQTRWLNVEGEEKLRGRGISSCAPCDAPFFKDKKVIVVGGGDAAMEEALVLTKYATSVTIVHRRDTFRASQAMQARISKLQGKLNIIWDSQIIGFVGEGKLSSVTLKTKKGSRGEKELKEKMLNVVTGKVVNENADVYWEMPVDGAFIAIGHTPATEIFKGQVELDDHGYVIKYAVKGFATATSKEGVFVAGDVHDYHYMQAITAAGYGCMAAMDAIKYLDTLEK